MRMLRYEYPGNRRIRTWTEEARPLRARKDGDEGIYPPCSVAGTLDDDCARCRQCLPWAACRYHDRGYISSGCDCNGGDAGVEGVAAGRKHCPDRGVDWGVGRGRCDIYDSSVLTSEGVAFVSACGRLLEVHSIDYGGQHSGSAVHFSGTTGHGGRP